MTTTTANTTRARLAEIQAKMDALYREVAARPEVGSPLADTMDLLAASGLHIVDQALYRGTVALAALTRHNAKMTDADRRREEALIGEWNGIAGEARARRQAARQAKVNAREVAKVRAAACPVCFATHAGEC